MTDRLSEELVPERGVWLRTRQRTANILFSGDKDEPWTRRVDIALITLITINAIAVIVESVGEYRLLWGRYLEAFELFSVIVFSLEYILRIWSVVDDPWKKGSGDPVRARLRFSRTTMAIIDLLAILPFYLGLFVQLDLRFLRVLRLLRVFKLTRYSGSMTLLFQVVREEGRTMGAAMFVLLLLLVIASSLAFIVEGGSDAPSEAFSSIPAAMYWAIITMTTVGYGDIVPATPMGKVLTAVLSIISVGMVALPAGILASGFTSALQRRREEVEVKIEDALADGLLSDQEQAEIDTLVNRLGVSAADLQAIKEAVQRDQGASPCPHCGKLPHEPVHEP